MNILLDNSALSTLHCKRKFKLTVVDGLIGQEDKYAFGNAYHKCLEKLDKGINPEDAVNDVLAGDAPINKVKLLKALIVAKSMPMPPAIIIDNEPAIEYKYKFLYKSIANHDIYLTGTIDRIYIEKDMLVVLDYKTSGAASEYQIAKTLKEYSMAFQLPFYLFCLQNGALPAPYLSYLSARQYCTEVQINFYNLENKIKRVIRPAYSDEFMSNIVPKIIHNRIEEIISILHSPDNAAYDGMNTYGACADCIFRPACMVAGTDREKELLCNYTQKTYNPMEFR